MFITLHTSVILHDAYSIYVTTLHQLQQIMLYLTNTEINVIDSMHLFLSGK